MRYEKEKIVVVDALGRRTFMTKITPVETFHYIADAPSEHRKHSEYRTTDNVAVNFHDGAEFEFVAIDGRQFKRVKD